MNVSTKTAIANLVDDLPTLQEGISSVAVAVLQQLLILEGFGANLTITGYFGDETHAAVLNFQQAAGLQQDGIAGPDVWSGLAQLSPNAD